jgi:predicted P-loop ATPase
VQRCKVHRARRGELWGGEERGRKCEKLMDPKDPTTSTLGTATTMGKGLGRMAARKPMACTDKRDEEATTTPATKARGKTVHEQTRWKPRQGEENGTGAICTIDLAQLQRELQGTGVQSTGRENQMLRRRVEWTRDRWWCVGCEGQRAEGKYRRSSSVCRGTPCGIG